MSSERKITGRCYCGDTTFYSTEMPLTVAYCHCIDCRRATAAPVAAFAAFEESTLVFEPDEGVPVSVNEGVTRTFCKRCGTSLTGRYDYLPKMVYVGLGVVDQARDLTPCVHSHWNERLPWLALDDDIEKFCASSRVRLNKPKESI